MTNDVIQVPPPIAAYLTALRDAGEVEALARVALARPEEWTDGGAVTWDGRRCLVGHADDYLLIDGETLSRFDRMPLRLYREYPTCQFLRADVPRVFDRFTREVGILLAAEACRSFARSLLEEK